MLLQSTFPPDIRLEKEIKSLHENGYEVLLLCNQYEKGKNPEFPYCEIVRVKANFSNKKLNKIFNFPIIFNPRYLYYVLKTAFRFKPDFIHVHDLPMMPFGMLLKSILKKPLIFDMHENYPAALKAYNKKGILNKIFKNPNSAKKLEKIAVEKADGIIAVVEENKERLEKEYGVGNKIKIVSNTVSLKTFVRKPVNAEKFSDELSGKFIILYSGAVSHNRGLDVPVKAMKKIIAEIPNALMLIIGEGDARKYLKQIASELQLNDYVRFVDWPGHENLASFIHFASVCMIPQPAIESNNTTIPHKLFEYMLLGKPLVVSDAKPLARIVTEANCGKVFCSFDENDFASKIIELKNSETDYGNNGKKFVEEKYNWELRDEKALLKFYDEFGKKEVLREK